jgi:hypothetical protein
MSTHEISGVEIDRARTYLTDLNAYAPFDLTPGGRQMSGCMDPRPEELGSERHLVKVMGPGGAVGDAADLAVALTVTGDKQLFTIERAVNRDNELRRAVVHGAHEDCAYVGALAVIMAEQAEPSEFTRSSVE